MNHLFSNGDIIIKTNRLFHIAKSLTIGAIIAAATFWFGNLIPLSSSPSTRILLSFGYLPGILAAAWLLKSDLASGWEWLCQRKAEQKCWPVALLLLVWVVTAIILMQHTGLIRQDEPTGDEPEYIMLCRSILDDGDFTLDVDIATGVCNEFMSGRFSLRGQSVRPPGLPALLLPAYLVGRHLPWPGLPHTLYLWMALFYIWLGCELFLLIQAATRRPHLAWFGTLTAMLLPPLAPYAFQVYPEIPAAVLVLRLFRREFYGSADRNRLWDGVCLALIPVFHQKYMFLFVMSGLHLILGVFLNRRQHITDWIKIILPGAVTLVGLSIFFGHRFDIWLPTAPYSVNDSLLSHLFTLHTLKVIIAQFLDRKWGLIMVCPLLLFSLSGVVALWRRRPWVWVWWFLTCGGFIVLLSAYPLWWGGFSPPCRFILPIVPLLWFGATQFWARRESGRWFNIAICLVLLIVSLWFSGLMLFGSPYEYQICSPYLYPEESPNGSALWASVSTCIDWNQLLPAVERNGRWNHILPHDLRFGLLDWLILINTTLILIIFSYESNRDFNKILRNKDHGASVFKTRLNDSSAVLMISLLFFLTSIRVYNDDQQIFRYRHQKLLQNQLRKNQPVSTVLRGAYGLRTGEWKHAPAPILGIYYPPVYIQDMPDTLWPGGYRYNFKIPVTWDSGTEKGAVVFSVENRISRQKHQARIERDSGQEPQTLEVTLSIPAKTEALFKLVMYGDKTDGYSYQLPELEVSPL